MSVILYSREIWGVCKCGHYDWQHSDFVYGGEDGHDIFPRADGHGKCGFGTSEDEPCDCPQFTWVKTIPHRRDFFGSTLKEPPAPKVKNNE